MKKTKSDLKYTDKFSGVMTALVTPFYNNKVDVLSLKKLVKFQLENGIQGFVISGTTGESPTLLSSEVDLIFKTVRKTVDGRVPLIIGTGSNSTLETVRKTKAVEKHKPDAVLIVVPYYNKPPQRGIVAHYQQVAKKTTLPIILYNVPGRTIVSMEVNTIAELSKNKNIVGIKEASGNIQLLREIKSKTGEDFLLTSGDDSTCIDFILSGGHGVISVISHVIPKEMVTYASRARSADVTASQEYKKYETLNKLMGCEANPIPVKMALYKMGILKSPELRLPLVALSEEKSKELESELLEKKII